MEQDSRQLTAGKSSAAASASGPVANAASAGKNTQVQKAERGNPNSTVSQPLPPPGSEVPNLGASGGLERHFKSSYLEGPGGTLLRVDVSASMSGASDKGSAEISGGRTSVKGGKPETNVEYRYDNHFFSIGMTAEGHLKIDKPLFQGGAGDHLKWTIKEVSDGPTLSMNLEGTYKTESRGRETSVTVGLEVAITAIKKPPRGVKPEPEPVTIPLKLLVPTLVAVGGAAALTVILEGLGLALAL